MSDKAPQKSQKPYDQIDLLREYPNWHHPNQPYTEILQVNLEFPSKSLWLQACYHAVKDKSQAFLEKPPLQLFSRSNLQADKDIAKFISKCAFASLQIINNSETSNIREEFLQQLKEEYPNKVNQIKDLIQYFLLEKLQSEGEKAIVKVLLAGNEGILGQLEVEKIPNGEGEVFPDPVFMSFSRCENDFVNSISTAFNYIVNTESIEEAKTYNYRWRLFDRTEERDNADNLRVLDKSLKGSSMGFALALAFRQVLNKLNIPLKNYAFTGKIDESGNLKSVGAYSKKLDVGKGFIIYCPFSDYEKIKQRNEDNYIIRGVETVKDAIADIKNERKIDKIKKIRNWALVITLPLIILVLAVGVWIYKTNADTERLKKEIAQSESRKAQIAANTEKTQKEIAQSEANAKTILANARQKEAETEKQKRINKEKEAKLAQEQELIAKEQSKILAQKNVELDKAKNVAEKNEKEAKFQKGVAVKNEETAKAYQQVAQANQLAYQGLLSLNEKDYLSAQSYFAESIQYNDTPTARSGLLSATLQNPVSQKFNWASEQRTTETDNAFEAGSEVFFYRLQIDRTGEFFAYPISTKEISLRKVDDNTEIEKISFGEKVLDTFSLSPSGKYIAIGTSNGDLILRNNVTKAQEIILNIEKTGINEGDTRTFTSLAFNSNGNFLSVATGKKEIIILDINEQKIINSFPKKQENPELEEIDFDLGVISLSFNSSDGLAFSTIDSSLDSQIGFIPDVTKNTIIIADADEFVSKISFLNNNQLISSGIGWKTWTIGKSSIEEDSAENISAQPQTVAVSNPKFNFYISAGDDGKLNIWDSNKNTLIAKISQNMGKPFQIILGDNGVMLLQSITNDKKIKIFCWDLKEKGDSQLIASNLLDDYDTQLISYNGRYVDFNCSKRLLEVKDFFSKKIILSVQYDTSPNLGSLTLIPRLNQKGTQLLVKTEEREKIKNRDNLYTIKEKLSLYDLSSFEKTDIDVSKYREVTSKVFGLSSISSFCSKGGQTTILTSDNEEYLSNDGKKIALLTKDNSIAIFSTDDLSQPISIISNKLNSSVSLPADANFVTGFSISPNNQMLIRLAPTIIDIIENKQISSVLSFDVSGYYNFEFYDIQTKELKYLIPSPETLLSFSPSLDGKSFVMTDTGGYVYLWELEPYQRLKNVIKTGNYETALSPTISQDGKLLAWTSSKTGRIHFYDIENQKMLADWQTGELVGKIQFVDKDTASLLTYKGLRLVDLSSLPFLAFGDVSLAKGYVESQSNIFMIFPSQERVVFDQSSLDSILRTSKSRLISPKIFGRSVYSSEITTFENDSFVNQAGNFPNSNGIANCKPIFHYPIFNPYPLSFTNPQYYCSHYPLIDVRRVKDRNYSQNQQEWESIRQISNEEEYYGLLYLSNGAANNLPPEKGNIRNVRIRIIITLLQNGNHSLEATVVADNASSLSATLKLETLVDKQIAVGDIIEIFNYRGEKLPLKTIKMSEVLQKEGNNTTFEIPIGDLPPGFSTDLFVRFSFIAK